MSERASAGLIELYFNDTHLGHIHEDSNVEHTKVPYIKKYYKKGRPDQPVREEVKYYNESLTVSLFYSDAKKTLFEQIGTIEGALRLEGEEVKEITNMSAIADFKSVFTAEGKDYINVKFTKLNK